MKRANNLLDKICDPDNLYLAFHKARSGSHAKYAVLKYQSSLDSNIAKLRRELLSGAPVVGEYNFFKIYDPKERLICSASFPQKVMQNALMNICMDRFERHLVFDTYASRKDKGTYAAIERARQLIKKYPYVVKLDVRKFFESIDHEILKKKLAGLFKERKLLDIFEKIIDSYESARGKGIPIGNLTSQYFANHYLSAYDHYLKECMKVPAAVRYMDDVLIFAESKEDAKKYEYLSRTYLKNECGLELKPAVYANGITGVSFLGYRLYKSKILLSKRSKTRLKRKIILYGEQVHNGEWSQEEYRCHIVPVIAFAQKAYTKKLRNKILETTATEGRV